MFIKTTQLKVNYWGAIFDAGTIIKHCCCFFLLIVIICILSLIVFFYFSAMISSHIKPSYSFKGFINANLSFLAIFCFTFSFFVTIWNFHFFPFFPMSYRKYFIYVLIYKTTPPPPPQKKTSNILDYWKRHKVINICLL